MEISLRRFSRIYCAPASWIKSARFGFRPL